MRCVLAIIIVNITAISLLIMYTSTGAVQAPLRVIKYPIVFLHLPKTAGTTFTYMLYSQYANVTHPHSQKHEIISDFAQFINFTMKEPPKSPKWKFLSVHEDFSLLSYIPMETSVLTIIRSPVLHRRSVFYSGLNDYKKKYDSLHSWVLSGDYPAAYQLDFLAGASHVYPKSRYPKPVLNELSNIQLRLKIAKQNLEATAWFGITEYWNASMCMFEHAFGKIPEYELHHVWNANYPPMRPNEVALIKLRSSYEEELFDYALELFNKRLEKTICHI